jgi:hypothetical protein
VSALDENRTVPDIAPMEIFELFRGLARKIPDAAPPEGYAPYRVFEYTKTPGTVVVWFFVPGYALPHTAGYLPEESADRYAEEFHACVRAHVALTEVKDPTRQQELVARLKGVFENPGDGFLDLRIPVPDGTSFVPKGRTSITKH